MAGSAFLVEVEGASTIRCSADENLLQAMERAGKSAIKVGCRGGGCGICRVRVLSGRYTTRPMSVTRVTSAERVTGYALACRLSPASDLRITSAVPDSLAQRLKGRSA